MKEKMQHFDVKGRRIATGSVPGNATVGGINATGLKSTTTTTTTATTSEAMVSYGVIDVANLPLLVPFQIRNPSESMIVQAIMNEQHASDALAAAMMTEESLRNELQKAASSSTSSSSDDKDDNATKNASAGSAVTKKGVANNAKKKVKSATTILLMKKIESEINSQIHIVAQCQHRLATAANWTRAMIQAEYSMRAVLLDPNSRSFVDLEEAYTFLFARLGATTDGVPTDNDPTHYYHEQRIAYVHEMLPVMKNVGGRAMRESISALPYVRQFQCESTLIDAMIDEMHQLAIAQGLRTRLDMKSDPAKNKVLRHAEEILARRVLETDELVRKWYRRRSVKIHPDKNGEHMRPAFEEFTEARNVLSDMKLRQNYLRNMLDLTQYYNTTELSPQGMTNKLMESHDSWNRRNRPDKVERKESVVKKNTAGKKEKTLQLEGGLYQQMPKGVIWHQRYERQDTTTTTKSPLTVVSISIHALSPIHDFYAKVRTVYVVLSSTDNDTHTFFLNRSDIVKTIQVDTHGPILASEIPVIEKSLNPGNWEVFWFAVLDIVGTDPLNPENATKTEAVATRHSAIKSFEIVDYTHASLLQSFEQAERNCKVVKGELSRIMHKHRTNKTEHVLGRSLLLPFKLSRERYGLYHQTHVRARKKCQTLYALITKLKRKSSVYDELAALLSQSRMVLSELEEAVDANNKRQEKKFDVKRFKSYIASILEGDDPMAWMKNVTSAELLCEGGDVNKLYQLFIEGKGQLSLMFDSEVFTEASLREDLFSAKQRKDLVAKGKEAATAEAKEEEEAIAAEVKNMADEVEREKLRKEGELREKWSMVGHNATIHGLTSEKGKHLNNHLARIIYFLIDKDRFEVGLYKSNKKALLKSENLTIYYGHVPTLTLKEPLQQLPTHMNIVEMVQPPYSSSALNINLASTVEKDDSSIVCSMSTAPKPKELKLRESKMDGAVELNVPTAVPQSDQKSFPSPPLNGVTCDGAKMKSTIYVTAAHSKKLTEKRELINKSGAADIQIETSAIGTQVCVHLIGSQEANLKAIALIQDKVGVENVSENLDNPPFASQQAPSITMPQPSAPSALVAKATALSAHIPSPSSSVPAPSATLPEPSGLVRKKSTAHANSYQSSMIHSDSSIFAVPPASGFVNGVNHDVTGSGFAKGVHYAHISSSDFEPTSQFSYDDALLPCGLMDTSISTPTKSLPREVPSEIGIRSLLTRETITITEDGDRSSSTSNTSYNSTLNENDPLFLFLKSQHLCIKGNIEEFYIWLVKSEDIDSMAALMEAVSDDEYLEDSMKVGCGTSGLKGFKRKAFQRAVLEYNDAKQADILSTRHNASSPLCENGNPLLLPANLFSEFDEY